MRRPAARRLPIMTLYKQTVEEVCPQCTPWMGWNDATGENRRRIKMLWSGSMDKKNLPRKNQTAAFHKAMNEKLKQHGYDYRVDTKVSGITYLYMDKRIAG